MNTTFMTYRDECEKLREEVERLRATVAAQSAALELAKMALSMPCNFWNKTQHEKIKEALAAINALPAAPKGGAE